MQLLNVGIIGAGFIGKVHAYGYSTLPLFYPDLPVRGNLKRVCTSRAESAEKAKWQLGAEEAATDFRAITEASDIDVIHICTPNHLHLDALLSAMQHNKHIYCDKPLVVNMEEAAQAARALKSYSGIAQMTLQNRFFPAVMRAKQLIEEGFPGQVLEYRASYLHSGSAIRQAPLKWKLSEEAGGGVIADLGSHVVDLIHHLLGDYESLVVSNHIAYPDRPSADGSGKRVPVRVEDCTMMLARMHAGGLGHIEAIKLATGTEDEVRFEIHGEMRALRFNSMAPHYLDVYDASAPDKPIGGTRGWTSIATGQRYPEPAAAFPGPKFSIGWLRVHAACLANFLHAITENRPAEPGLDQGIYVQYLLGQMRQSAQEHGWVHCTSKSDLLSGM